MRPDHTPARLLGLQQVQVDPGNSGGLRVRPPKRTYICVYIYICVCVEFLCTVVSIPDKLKRIVFQSLLEGSHVCSKSSKTLSRFSHISITCQSSVRPECVCLLDLDIGVITKSLESSLTTPPTSWSRKGISWNLPKLRQPVT